ncbi:MAG: uroporphyrinogen decarboxylase [Planctomycetota bacterium]|jgi:uroporphyrinogen decarboxylase
MSGDAPLLVRALRGEAVERVPAWIMRQAGRYLPEYLELKAQHGFLGMVRDPELAAEVTLQPLRRFPLDGAILFSDIMTPLPAMGVPLEFNPGPVMDHPLRTRADVEALKPLEPETDVAYVADALRLIRERLEPGVALLGFAGSPWTVASYVVEGKGSKGECRAVRAMMHDDPETLHLLLERLADATVAYLRMQIEAGADAVQIFDTWGGVHARETYREFDLQYVRRIVDGLADLGTPVMLYAGGATHLLEEAAQSGAQGISVDHRLPLDEARTRLGEGIALQGNLDPATLLGDRDVLREAAADVIRRGGGRHHVFNLGHGIWPNVDPEAVAVLLEAVRESSTTVCAEAAS